MARIRPSATMVVPLFLLWGTATQGAGVAQDIMAPRSSPTIDSTSLHPSRPEDRGWGTFRGRVIFTGKIPPRKVIKPTKDLAVLQGREPPILSERILVDPETAGVANALVYLEEPRAIRDSARASSPRAFRLAADRGMFVPHVLAAMEGTEINITSQDAITSHIRYRSPIASAVIPTFVPPEGGVDREEQSPASSGVKAPFGGVVREQAIPASSGLNALFGGDDARTLRGPIRVTPLATPSPVVALSDIHTWMYSCWLVLKHPYFAVTDDRGRFVIRDVPTGPQRVVVWHEAADPRTRAARAGWRLGEPSFVFRGDVVMKEGRNTAAIFTLDAKQLGDDER